MVGGHLGAVGQPEPDPARGRLGAGDLDARPDRDVVQARDEPRGAGRPDRPARQAVLALARHPPPERGPRDEVADPGRADVRPRVEHARHDRHPVLPAAREPVDVALADDDLGVRAGLAQQRGRLERALPAAGDDDPPAVEGAQVAVLDGVRHEPRAERVEQRRPVGEGGDPGGDDHAARAHRLAVLELEDEPVAVRLHAADGAVVEAGHGPALEPAAVVDEAVQRHRRAERLLRVVAIVVEGEAAAGVRQVARDPRRAQEHAGGHVALPEGHRRAEDADVQAVDGPEVRRGAQPVRARADDRDVALGRLGGARAGDRSLVDECHLASCCPCRIGCFPDCPASVPRPGRADTGRSARLGAGGPPAFEETSPRAPPKRPGDGRAGRRRGARTVRVRRRAGGRPAPCACPASR